MSHRKSKMSTVGNFVLGGTASCTATIIVHPIDVVKTRMQLSGEGGTQRLHRTAFHAIYNISTQEGVKIPLQRPLSSRPPTIHLRHNKGKLWVNAAIGMVAGAFGALAGTPADVALIRMASDGRLPPNERRGYTNVFNALTRISHEEGITGLWKGVQPTVIRAMVLNAAQLGGYDYFKNILLSHSSLQNGLVTHILSSMMSGLLCSVLSLPIDITKTRLQTMKPAPDGTMPYTGMIHCASSLVRLEGVPALWKGFTPYYLRLGPQTVLTFIILEQLKKNFSF